jgi:hypothetical protein
MDTLRFPMLSTTATCAVCLSPMQRFEIISTWICTNTACGEEETDAQLDERLTSEAEAAEERRLGRG